MLAAFCGQAPGQNIGMPPGAVQWIEAKGNNVADGICCDDAVGGTGAIPDPSPNYCHTAAGPGAGVVLLVNGDSTASIMRSSYFCNISDPFFVYNSMVDTYTISGPAGTQGTPVQARLIYRAGGLLFVAARPGNAHVGTSNLELEVGTWSGGTDGNFNEQFRVTIFDPAFRQFAQIPFANYGGVEPTMNADLAIDQVLTRTVGEAFDVAFGLNLQGSGAGNISAAGSPGPERYIFGTIDWELPAGYTITSARGWTRPCPADYNHDGFVDGIDYDSFNNAFENPDPAEQIRADYNHDGFVDGIDYDLFNNDFETPC
jgi:hypothetical protein